MRRTARILAVAIAAMGLAPVTSHAEDAPVAFTGSAKSLLLRSETLTSEPYVLSLSRLRLSLQGRVTPALAVDVQYDNEVLLGNYLRTEVFKAAKDVPPPQYWHAYANTLDRADVYAAHRLYRASLTLSRGPVDVKLGRQRIAWGTGRFWSPLDILNPVNPLALERDERLGVDAVLVEAKTGPVSRLSVVYAPSPDRAAASRALRWHGNRGGVDVSVVAGHLSGLDVLGADIAGQVGLAGVRAEVASLRPPGGRRYDLAMAGIDYAFASGLTLGAEVFYNGHGSRDARPAAESMTMEARNLGTRYAGVSAAYDVTPLLKWTTILVINADDRSRGIDTRLVWSWHTDVDLTLGLQRFGGPPGSEYRRSPAATFAQLQWYF